jgi:hypothetical protein
MLHSAPLRVGLLILVAVISKDLVHFERDTPREIALVCNQHFIRGAGRLGTQMGV